MRQEAPAGIILELCVLRIKAPSRILLSEIDLSRQPATGADESSIRRASNGAGDIPPKADPIHPKKRLFIPSARNQGNVAKVRHRMRLIDLIA